ncbi:hypothetical protein AAVH_15311 [Aphelenchoides avenae]|nr:hypothetical protein AAVH_15311 [Aphelenchus avenae]
MASKTEMETVKQPSICGVKVETLAMILAVVGLIVCILTGDIIAVIAYIFVMIAIKKRSGVLYWIFFILMALSIAIVLLLVVFAIVPYFFAEEGIDRNANWTVTDRNGSSTVRPLSDEERTSFSTTMQEVRPFMWILAAVLALCIALRVFSCCVSCSAYKHAKAVRKQRYANARVTQCSFVAPPSPYMTSTQWQQAGYYPHPSHSAHPYYASY